MFDFLKKKVSLSRAVEVGWTLDTTKATFIWEAPSRLTREEKRTSHAKSVSFCPAVIDHDSRLFQVNCPVDIQIRIDIDPKTNEPKLRSTAGDMATIRPKALAELVRLNSPKEWRHPKRPILQIASPYIFLADELAYMMQLPAFNHYYSTPLPGVMIGGRLPIHIWPRPMMWAFEWHDISKELVLKRGDPWFYVRFEFQDPTRPVRLVEADMTPQLREYMQGVSSVTNYVSRTYSLFETAKSRRPRTLLIEKQR
ncbi:hypothetical protein [Bradyrhizobium sp. USDA 4454]